MAGKKFTIILKDALLPKDPDTGREQSTVSWEYDFSVEKDVEKSYLIVPWPYFKPTYRGKEKKDAKCLDLSDVRRFSIMARRYVELISINASEGIHAYCYRKLFRHTKGTVLVADCINSCVRA